MRLNGEWLVYIRLWSVGRLEQQPIRIYGKNTKNPVSKMNEDELIGIVEGNGVLLGCVFLVSVCACVLVKKCQERICCCREKG